MNPNSHDTEGLDRTSAGAVSGDPTAPQWGHLQLLAEVGSGSFGQVYRAWDTVLHRQVALKLLPKGSPDDLLAEARLLAGIDDPGVIRVLGADVHDGTPGLWMDFVDGVNLATRVREEGRLSLEEALSCGIQIAHALAAVHGAGLLHRDIKPANVMQKPDGRVVLMDLGTSRPRDETVQTYSGTPFFMAPEVLTSYAESPRSDIYSLGTVLYHLVSGELPVTGSTLEELQAAHIIGRITDLKMYRPDLPQGFLDLVNKATAPNPKHRFESADSLAAALEKLAGRNQRTGGRGRLAGIAAALAVATLAAFFTWQSLRPGSGESVPMEGTIAYVSYQEGVAQTLGGGDTLSPGERLGINLELSAAAFVYILNRDESGAVTVMYPLAGGETAEPLNAHVRHYLPGSKGEQRLGWTFNSLAGEESFVVIASRDRLEEFELHLASLPAVEVGGGLTVRPVGPVAISSLMRGVSGLAGITLPTTSSGNTGGADLAQLVNLTSAPDRAGETTQVWIHEMTLHNEGL